MRRVRHGAAAVAVPLLTAVLTAGCTATGAPGPAASAQVPRATADSGRSTSTFALDVDTASYGFAKRTLADGRLPARATVRPEEFVNSLPQGYPQPPAAGFSLTLDGARAGATGWTLLRVGLATRAQSQATRPPVALTFVIDISGSMGAPGRLDLVEAALDAGVDALRPDDSIALVTFSGTAIPLLSMTRLGDRANRARLHRIVAGLAAADRTNLQAGLDQGYDFAVAGLRKGADNRVVLMSDGLPNVGDTKADALLARIAAARRDHGITLFGVGVGDGYGDALMERLADRGDGHTAYVADDADARALFTTQLAANTGLRARDAKAQVAFDPAAVTEYRLTGFDDRALSDDGFRDDRVDGGEIGPGHTVTALYWVRLKPGAQGRVATATVRWLDPDSRAPHEQSAGVDAAALRGELWKQAAPPLKADAVAAYLASALSGAAPLPGQPSLGALVGRARTLAGKGADPALRALAHVVQEASDLRG